MKINRQTYLDKVHACWIGKNIGGTMGAPYECKTEMQDIKGFITAKGEPLGNDDLDLQLCWLCAVEERGIQNVTPQTLAEYWINYIPPHWNEYGYAKTNLKMGLLPPYSGEFHNEKWKNSNGAWIRTEIWACLFPGVPELAAQHAYNDACVDHGLGEGTYAAMFVAAMQSCAFFENDIRKVIDKGLSFIPESSRVAKSVRLAIKLYDQGTPFVEARNAVVQETADLGWFQAPNNVGFVILGLLYGEGDYKKSMIYTINCGDDTDCTGGTVGSLMGIMNGTKGIPQDWSEYIGDKIVTISLDLSYLFFAKTCTEITQRIHNLVPASLMAYGIYMEYTDGENELEYTFPLFNRNPRWEIPRTGLSMNFPDSVLVKARVEFDKYTIKPFDTVTFKFVAQNTTSDQKRVVVRLLLPEGWTSDRKTAAIYLNEMYRFETGEAEIKVTAGENVDSLNKIYAELTVNGRPTVSILPILIEG